MSATAHSELLSSPAEGPVHEPVATRLETLGWGLALDGNPEEATLLAKLEEFVGYL